MPGSVFWARQTGRKPDHQNGTKTGRRGGKTKQPDKQTNTWSQKHDPQNENAAVPKLRPRRGRKFCALAAAGMKKAAQKTAPKTKPETANFARQSGTLPPRINGAVASKMFARTLL